MSNKDLKAAFPFLKNGVWQVGAIVGDIDKAVEACWNVCGVGPWQIFTYQKPFVKWMTYRGNPGNYKMRVAIAPIGSHQLELIEPLEGPSIYHEFVAERGYGLHHIGVLVDDLEAAMAQAEAAGFPVIQAGGGHGLDGDGGYAYLDTEAKLGIIYEVMTPPKRRAQPEKVYPPERNP
jgi:catechol 2,3-dioxygenase-like lactoylglutathione lyase family enzyme